MKVNLVNEKVKPLLPKHFPDAPLIKKIKAPQDSGGAFIKIEIAAFIK